MNASSWSLRNLPWFKATLAQWRYALRNTIAMCLALTVAYYLNLDESEFESLTYHHVSQLSNSQDALARRWLLRWGVVLLNCSHVVWQLRDWESRSDPLSRVRDNCISLLRGVMSERGVQQKSLAATLEELQRICDSFARHHQPAARELAAIVWRLYCSLSQLEQAPPQGTLAS